MERIETEVAVVVRVAVALVAGEDGPRVERVEVLGCRIAGSDEAALLAVESACHVRH